MFSRNIGRVINIDSFRVIIELDEDLKGLFKNNFEEIHEIARINSYVVLPVGDEKVIGLVTKVKIDDETKVNYNTGDITLPKAKRLLAATLVGSINSKQIYSQGINCFPILDNPVWYVVKEELEIVFDCKTEKHKIDFKRDYFLPIGKSAAFPDFEVKINPDRFFGKHVAVLGNTGSGKSCTISSILQSIFKRKYRFGEEDKYIDNAHIVIFDTNGEYARAFKFDDPEVNKRVNTFSISKEGLKVPYWFMNYEDFDYLFKPSQQTQAPVLKRAISMAKGKENLVANEVKFDEVVLNKVIRLKDLLLKNDKETKMFIIHELDDLLDIVPEGVSDSIDNIYDQLKKLKSGKTKGGLVDSYGIKGDISSKVILDAYNVISEAIEKIINNNSKKLLSNDKDIDLPIYFNFQDLITKYIDESLEEMGNSKSRYSEYLSSLKLRLSSYLSDSRLSNPFMLNEKNFDKSLSLYLKYVLGILVHDIEIDFKTDTTELKQSEKEIEESTMSIKYEEETVLMTAADKEADKHSNILEDYKFKHTEQGFYQNVVDSKKLSQVTIIDLSLLPYEVIENFTGLIGRLILEFVERIEKVKDYENKRGQVPIVLVLEEGQNYIPERNMYNDRVSISKIVFERIAREGRKFGLSLMISSQRPSELSKTILSQCNTFIVHRLQNPEDQKYIRQIVSSADEDILNQLPILPQQHAIILGEGVKTPAQVYINDANPTPDSQNPEFMRCWLEGSDIDIEKVVDVWINTK